MTITAILWLQSGRRFEETELPDDGCPPAWLKRVVAKKPSMWGPLDPAHLLERCDVETLTFELTDPAWERVQYRVGRRRFHYRETAGWRSREELYERDLHRDRDARFQRIVAAIEKHQALMRAGAFPGEAPHPVAYQLPPDLNPGYPIPADQLKDAIELLKQMPVLPESDGS